MIIWLVVLPNRNTTRTFPSYFQYFRKYYRKALVVFRLVYSLGLPIVQVRKLMINMSQVGKVIAFK